MNNAFYRFFKGFSAFLLLVSLMIPQVTLAATKKKATRSRGIASWLYNSHRRYGDEHTDIADPTSRCNTPAMRKLHAGNVLKALDDGKRLGVTTTTEGVLGDAYRTYLNNLGIIWDAMTEPYCGFGAFGMTAVKKSYEKSIDATRETFAEAVTRSKGMAVAK